MSSLFLVYTRDRLRTCKIWETKWHLNVKKLLIIVISTCLCASRPCRRPHPDSFISYIRRGREWFVANVSPLHLLFSLKPAGRLQEETLKNATRAPTFQSSLLFLFLSIPSSHSSSCPRCSRDKSTTWAGHTHRWIEWYDAKHPDFHETIIIFHKLINTPHDLFKKYTKLQGTRKEWNLSGQGHGWWRDFVWEDGH